MKFIKLMLFLISISLIFPSKSHAYIDPGTGSYLFQIIAASLITVLLSARTFLKFVRNILGRITSFKKSKK
ncbi:hypothetical protein A3D05_04895 [Candidatus Gottesmanbacteria bacterium RIFCSPHIGHO2_02_FULL_40_24]|uniref:Uncharacterized protein n=1 Tax=Candidatus Gottesmanbacteria bacterium RIFCSPHIGHO2_01_FULL_40_15 TaxID=1798376 RepID=A0A1F5Z1Z4_9BACT|nr:MAG: hypothetical protein A2777_05925 [Candidatus Gottesmanbacteria bacterium RIFCSPHIGHO2_01_FULL_40_15]OGG16208.1 MAG: hypothetical protein A3D05_04895 [Candidatus Gottesmanbacteria bacterium RIFCSPHIGHO2_02_FULL_40_24]OGG32292.1 MAG: hypothetical protein A3I80_03235 [Candidatus Gottesmanbacteria bacterium RIFCSPLOWO2_02_FULL_40_10]